MQAATACKDAIRIQVARSSKGTSQLATSPSLARQSDGARLSTDMAGVPTCHE